MTPSVAMVEDHPMFRRGLRVLLDECGFDVVAECATAADALDRLPSLRPDVVLVDLQLPDLNGAELTRRLLAAEPALRICILTMFDEDRSVLDAIQAGALGYVLKGADGASIERAVHAVAAGESLFSPGLTDLLQREWRAQREAPRREAFPTLTPREAELLDLVARGLDNPAIARQLGLSEKTVRNTLSTVLTKLGVPTRARAIVAAREAGLGGS